MHQTNITALPKEERRIAGDIETFNAILEQQQVATDALFAGFFALCRDRNIPIETLLNFIYCRVPTSSEHFKLIEQLMELDWSAAAPDLEVL